MPLVDLLALSPTQLKALFDQGELGKYSLGYLEDANLFHDSIWGKVIGMDSAGDLVWLPQDTTGRMPVQEKWSTDISTYQNYLSKQIAASNPLCYSGAGVSLAATSLSWKPIAIPQTLLAADGAGAVAATDIVPATAAKTTEAWIIFQANTTGSYLFDWCEDPTGGATVTIPDYTTAAVSLSMVAGMPYGPFLIRAVTANATMGWKVMANGSWPNNAQMAVYGARRMM